MIHSIIPLVVATLYASAPAINLHAQSKDPISCMKANPDLILIAQKHAGDDPHGPDPHGDDPNDEIHDKGLPANQEKSKYKAPKDVYGGEVENGDTPY